MDPRTAPTPHPRGALRRLPTGLPVPEPHPPRPAPGLLRRPRRHPGSPAGAGRHDALLPHLQRQHPRLLRHPTRESDEALEEARRGWPSSWEPPSSRCVSFGHNMTSPELRPGPGGGSDPAPRRRDPDHPAGPRGQPGSLAGASGAGGHGAGDPPSPSGTLDLEDARGKIGERTRLVAMGCSSNFIGTVNDVETIRKWTYEVGAWLSLDAVHYAPHFPLDVAALGRTSSSAPPTSSTAPTSGCSTPGRICWTQLPTDRLRTQDPRAPYRIETGTLNRRPSWEPERRWTTWPPWVGAIRPGSAWSPPWRTWGTSSTDWRNASGRSWRRSPG